MGTILTNGKIYIGKGNFQEAMLIENGIIEKVGSHEEMLKENHSEIIDLKGQTVLPGLNDSHLHLGSIGEVMTTCDLTGAKSIDDVIQIGKNFLKNNKDIKFLSGRGWNEDYFTTGDKRSLSRFDLDKISKDFPIVFKRVCGHVATGNTQALEILNIDKNTKVKGY